MQTFLFFDTETTGLPRNWKAPVSDLDNWPRLVQLGWLLYDENGTKLDEGNVIVRPEGFTIPTEASDVHGITTAKALREGKELHKVLASFALLVEETDYLVAHNMAYDEKVIGSELLRAHMPNIVEQKPKICTMNASINFCAIPGPWGYKWPKLQELHNKLFGCEFEDAHDAFADISATAKCFFELRKRGII